jgi:hypothetical protein
MYTQNKYNTAICTYIAVALVAAATTVLKVWPLAWSRDSILFYVSGQGTVHWVTISRRSFRGYLRRIPRRQCAWRSFGHHDWWRFFSTAMHFNLMSHAVSCWLATALSRMIICLTYSNRHIRGIKMVIDEIWCERWLHLFWRRPG